MERVFITGLGVVSPVGVGQAAFREGLASEEKPRVNLPTWDFFDRSGLPRNDKTRQLDHLSQCAVVAAQEALAEAGWDGGTTDQPRPVGVVFGTAFGCVDSNERYYRQFLKASDPRLVSPVVFQNTVSSAAAGQVSILCGLRDFNLTLTSGLTAGLQAVGYAADLLRHGRGEVVLAGGIDCPSPTLLECYDRLNLWDQPAANLIRAGAGLVVLEGLPLEEGPAVPYPSPYMEVRGYGWQQGGWTFPPSPDSLLGSQSKGNWPWRGDPADGLARAIRQALNEAGCDPAEVARVYLAGTSSLYLQKAEEKSLERVFGIPHAGPERHDLKARLGEPLGAWGGLALVALALHEPQPEGITLINALDFDGNAACLAVEPASG